MNRLKIYIERLLLLVLTLFLVNGCEKRSETPEVVNLEEKEGKGPSLEELQKFLFEKLKGQKLVRNYGEDTGWTNLEFLEDGNFTGSYFGKIKNDGFDAGLTEYAWIWHRGEEIHTSDFKGKFKIVEQINDNIYKMKLDNFEITSEYGRYDDIYFNVDFALGIKPDADYYLYIPGTPASLLPNENSRLDKNYKKEDSKEDKTQGFIIWNKYEDEVFNQLAL
ncbi:Uncharacterised protein [Anaerococcus octavius]|uniref:Uncharacterized protein n=1 Tax=Anaerococcus octavius TaxID=54007 RepID=A0A380WVX4_9FIRM|nr:hypothetical protein [Anaerococcus octavius]SUU92959.1 Uncharacterised protein [Anaerococcus octavius]